MQEDWQISVCDMDLQLAERKVSGHERGTAQQFDVTDEPSRKALITQHDLVVSMLPASLHLIVVKDCLEIGRHLITPSYITPEIKQLDQSFREKGIIVLNEIGLDPGIDHLSAMKLLDEIRDRGGEIKCFESFAGGLIAPESDNNPWGYKFTWNPRNVVLAGQGGVIRFKHGGRFKYIPYHKLFRRTEFLDIEGHGSFEAYANRDSLKYREAYGLQQVLTLYRGTMRRVGFSKAWQMFVILGMTDDSYIIENSQGMSHREFVNLFLPYSPTDSVELKLRHYLKIDQDDIMWGKLLELDLFDPNKKIPLERASPAQILQHILEQRWTLEEHEKDMIVMYHKFGYELEGKKLQLDTNMVVLGENKAHTAMSKTVGLPVAMAALQILNGKIKSPGVQLPLKKEVYAPILAELKSHGILFKEYEVPYTGYNPNSRD